MVKPEVVELLETLAKSGEKVHGFPASKMLVILQEGIARNARLRVEQEQFPGQGGKQRYIP